MAGEKEKKNDGGTHNVAIGVEKKDQIKKKRQAQRDRIDSMSDKQRESVRQHLHRNAERRSILKKEDKVHLKKFKEGGGKKQKHEAQSPQQRARQRRQAADKIVKAKLRKLETKQTDAALAATDAEALLNTQEVGIIEAERGMERTVRVSQRELKFKHLDEQTARHIYDLHLNQHQGPFGLKYDRSGRCGILYGKNGGSVSLLDCESLSLQTEFFVQETVRDVVFLHNPTLMAVAQKNHVFVYDNQGVEIHKLTDHVDVFALDFLPYHFLLATVGRPGWLRYHDTSTGLLVSEHPTKLGPCGVMRQNPSNAVMHLGHTNGTVTLWSPTCGSDYLAKIQCHRGASVLSLAIDGGGHTMVTGGADGKVKVWDLRMYKDTHTYTTLGGVPVSLDVSQKGVMGTGHGCHSTFWKPSALRIKEKEPYMRHDVPGTCLETLRFRPFQDVCALGHSKGMSSIVIPGSGEPNLDSMEYHTNPYQDTKQRREADVRSLLDKLAPEMIALDPDVVGTMEESNEQFRQERIHYIQEEANKHRKPPKKQKVKKRGRSKIQTQLRRKHKNIVDSHTTKLRGALKKSKAGKAAAAKGFVQKDPKESAPTALKRFF